MQQFGGGRLPGRKEQAECASAAQQSSFRTAAWTLSNLARGRVTGQAFLDTGKLAQLLQWMDSRLVGGEGAEEMWWLFAFLTAKEDSVVAHCMQLGLISVNNISVVELNL